MKKWIVIIIIIFLITIFGIGIKINADLNELAEAFHSEHNLKDENFNLLKVQISPNKKFKFFEYQFDNGGFGYSRTFWSVVGNDSTKHNLEKGILPDGYRALDWTNDNELIIEKWKPYYFINEAFELKSGDLINGVKLKLKK